MSEAWIAYNDGYGRSYIQCGATIIAVRLTKEVAAEIAREHNAIGPLLEALGSLADPENRFPCINAGPERDELERIYQEVLPK